MLRVLSNCRAALQAGSVAVMHAALCVQTVFDSVKYNIGLSNLHVSIQAPDNGSGVVLF